MDADDGIERKLAIIAEMRGANDTEPPVLGVLLMDRSGSMRNVRTETEAALKEYLRDLRTSPHADRMLTSVVSFADDARIEVPPTRASDLPDHIPFHPDGHTRLYATVTEALDGALRIEDWLQKLDRPVRIVVVVVTDGGDNYADPDQNKESAKELRRHLLESVARRALERGHTLLTIGLEVDAAEIAKAMGFPTDPDHAISVKKNREGIRETIRHTVTSMTGIGGFPR